MTDNRRAVLHAIALFWQQNEYPPNHRELTDATGISSTSVVDYHLRALRRDGFVTYLDGKVGRTLKLTYVGEQMVALNARIAGAA